MKAYSQIKRPLVCEGESEWPQIIWYAWGPPKTHFTLMQTRFLGREVEHPFYYDMDLGEVVAAVPGATSRVKHTQGLPGDPIEIHLASIIRRVASSASRSDGV